MMCVLFRLGENCAEAHSEEELGEWRERWEAEHRAESQPAEQSYSQQILGQVLSSQADR